MEPDLPESITDSTSSYSAVGEATQGQGLAADTAPHSSSSRPSSRRLGLAYSLLNFPSPHQLGQSTGFIRRSKSLRISDAKVAAVPRTSDVGTSEATNDLLKAVLSQDQDSMDEPDYHPPFKRPRLSPPKAVISTYDDKPLKEFSLFLPSKLPAAIPNSVPILRDFVFKTTTTYLRLWDLSPEMDCVEIRLPVLYEERLSSNSQFLQDFVTVVFREIPTVESIRELYMPKVEMQAETVLEEILAGIGVLDNTSVSHLFLPLTSKLGMREVAQYDYESLAAFLHSLGLDQLTVVSTDRVVGEFCTRLVEEVNALKCCSLRIAHRNEDLNAPGPDYITSLDEDAVPSGEKIEPWELVQSMNVYNVTQKQRRERAATKAKGQKQKAKGAFSSDCTYFDEAELNANSPFPSTIWNLDRLHNNGIDGTGTTIAIVDSGINFTHPAFKDKIVAVKNFVRNKIDNIDCVIDSDGHGTHCAGLAAASEFYCPTSTDPDSECILLPPGVAPGAKLVICKVVKTTDGDVDSDAFIAALRWLKELHVSGTTTVDVVSISLAATYYSHRQAQIISQLTGLGIIVVCCASNVGRLHLQPIAFPARLGQVLCIGAHDENGKPTSFSPVGRELDFLSPGDSLWGPGPGTKGPFAMDCASGTSCATPAVAGLICLILQAVTKICEKNPKKFEIGGKALIELIHNVWVMRELLKVISSSPGHHSDELGYGTLNPYRLLDRSDEEILRIVNDIVEDE